MNILIVDSDIHMIGLLADHMEKLFPDLKTRPRITSTGNLDIADGLFVLTGLMFDLVICGETVESSQSFGSGNGLRLMREFRQRYRNTPVIILSDKAAWEYSGFTTIYRGSPTLEANLEEALRELMPYLF